MTERESASSPPETFQTLLLIRHAKAENREKWLGDDWVRPLKKRGRRQADALAEMAEHWQITTLRTSPALRCVQTVEPLATRTGLRMEVDESIAEGRPIRLPSEKGVHAICAHGDNIPLLLGRLGVDWDRCQTGSIWKVALCDAGRVLHASYMRVVEA